MPTRPRWCARSSSAATHSTLAGALARRVAALLRKGLRDSLERSGQLGRHDPHLRRLRRGDLRQHLEVLVGEQTRVRGALVDRLEHGGDRLRLALGAQDRGLALALRSEDRRLLLAFGGEDLRLLLPLGGEDDRALLAVGAHLLLHRLL